MARSEGLEPPTPWFEAKYSIQLSYERKRITGISLPHCFVWTKTAFARMVGRIGFEPMTQRLKASCSTD